MILVNLYCIAEYQQSNMNKDFDFVRNKITFTNSSCKSIFLFFFQINTYIHITHINIFWNQLKIE